MAETKKTIEFALYSRPSGGKFEDFQPAGVWINTEGAVAADYLAFIQLVCERVLSMAAGALESEANASGRTIAGATFETFGSQVIQIADKALDVDSFRAAPAGNE